MADDSRRVSLLLGLLFGLVRMGSSSAAVALPMMADDLGVGVWLMTMGALVAALAPTYSVLLGARMAQRMGAAAVPTLGVAVLSARYAGPVKSFAPG